MFHSLINILLCNTCPYSRINSTLRGTHYWSNSSVLLYVCQSSCIFRRGIAKRMQQYQGDGREPTNFGKSQQRQHSELFFFFLFEGENVFKTKLYGIVLLMLDMVAAYGSWMGRAHCQQVHWFYEISGRFRTHCKLRIEGPEACCTGSLTPLYNISVSFEVPTSLAQTPKSHSSGENLSRAMACP